MTNPLVIVPCRKGSKRLPGKNIELLPFTLEAIDQAGLRLHTVVNTDCPECHYIARSAGFEVMHRTARQGLDDAPVTDVIRSVIYAEGVHDDHPVMLLQVTSPCRTWVHVDKLVRGYLMSEEPAVAAWEGKANGGGWVAPASVWLSVVRWDDHPHWQYWNIDTGPDVDTLEDMERAMEILGHRLATPVKVVR